MPFIDHPTGRAYYRHWAAPEPRAVKNTLLAAPAIDALPAPPPADGRQIGYVAWADSTRSLRDVLGTVGTSLLLGGALVALWPLWAAGLALVAASAVASHRRRP